MISDAPELNINKQAKAESHLRAIATKRVEVNSLDWKGLTQLIVGAFEDHYKEKMRKDWIPQMRRRRDNSDKYALAQEGELRQAGFRVQLSLPTFHRLDGKTDSLSVILEREVPDIFKDKNKLSWFMKEYPEFVVPEEV